MITICFPVYDRVQEDSKEAQATMASRDRLEMQAHQVLGDSQEQRGLQVWTERRDPKQIWANE